MEGGEWRGEGGSREGREVSGGERVGVGKNVSERVVVGSGGR